MDSVRGLSLLLVLVGSYISVESRSLEILGTIEDYKHASRSKLYPRDPKEKNSDVVTPSNQQVCSLCEQLVGDTKSFLTTNETQTTISSALHEACSVLQPFQGECSSLVDEYLPLIFAEISSVQPKELCASVALCNSLSLLLPKKDTPCSLCHELVDEILVKFSDPDTQLEIIQALLKGCTKLQGFAQQCKRLVFLYGPTVLATVEKLLETNDFCATIHICKADTESSSASPGLFTTA